MINIPDNVKALIFDCDGTLADNMPLHLEAWKEAYEFFGREAPLKFLDDLRGVPSEGIVRLYNEKYGDDLDPDKVADKKSERTLPKLPRARPVKPVVDTAREYKGKLPMALASSGKKEAVDMTLEAIGLNDVFDVMITSADDVKNPKPAPDIFLLAAEKLGVKPENCLVFEDGGVGIAAAEKAGMKVIDIRDYFEEGKYNYKRLYDNY